MMGLKSGRRGMKSPPLLIAVLLACVCVLGIHYWITSTRCMELQNRVMDLEGRVRRAAAERGAVEMKKNEFEDMLSKQKRQIDNIQTLHSSQMQNIRLLFNSEKENLLNNVTTKDNLILELQGQIGDLQKRLDDSNLEFKELEESQAKKSAFELTQCGNKIKEMNEQCDEKLRRLAEKDANAIIVDDDKIIIKSENVKPTIPKEEIKQKDSDVKEDQPKDRVPSEPSKSPVNTQKPVIPPTKTEEKSNKLDVVDEKKPSPLPQQPKLEEKDEDILDADNEVIPENVNAEEEEENEPKAEDVADKEANKETENEEIEREIFINMDEQQEDEKDPKQVEPEESENQNDYNGDDGNEAEPEADKQAQLIDNDQNLKDDKIQNVVVGQVLDQEGEDSDDPPVK